MLTRREAILFSMAASLGGWHAAHDSALRSLADIRRRLAVLSSLTSAASFSLSSF
jgi:hypothetical protein